MTREESVMTRPSEGDWYYEQLDLGFNYRLTDVQAALGSHSCDVWTSCMPSENCARSDTMNCLWNCP